MSPDEPLAFFLTWTVYGTHLQGDASGWRRRRAGWQAPQPQLAQWRVERLIHEILLLSPHQRDTVDAECRRLCVRRGWHLWAVNSRSNHVHAVVTACGYSGKTVRDQLKANCTRVLRERWPAFTQRPVWSVGGDWDCIDTEDDLATVCEYVIDAQDRMEHKQQ